MPVDREMLAQIMQASMRPDNPRGLSGLQTPSTTSRRRRAVRVVAQVRDTPASPRGTAPFVRPSSPLGGSVPPPCGRAHAAASWRGARHARPNAAANAANQEMMRRSQTGDVTAAAASEQVV
jgi:hypothetical protein